MTDPIRTAPPAARPLLEQVARWCSQQPVSLPEAPPAHLLPSGCDLDEWGMVVRETWNVARREVERQQHKNALPAEALAARPLLEQVARMGDRIGQHTVAEISTISDRAAAWLRENPPGQPVAIEPRGCPIPGACACVVPAPPAEGEVAKAFADLEDGAAMLGALNQHEDAEAVRRAADLLERQQPVPVPVSERPWERAGWCDELGRCWWGRSADEFCNPDWHYATYADVEEFCSDAMPHVSLPAHALPLPAGEVQP